MSDNAAESRGTTLVFVRDLMFGSKIGATARELAIPVKFVRNPDALMAEEADRLILDLNQDGAIESAKAWKSAHGGVTIGFAFHVDTAVIEQAKQAGIDRIYTRGQFTQLLPNLLAE